MTLRPYQVDTATAVLADWADGEEGPLVVLPCGMGKTVIFAELCRVAVTALGRRPLILVNRDELVQQTVRKLWAADPTLPVGVIQGARNEVYGTAIVVASVQTLSRAARLAAIPPERFDVLVADEAHYSAADSWQRVFAHFGRALKVGFTATPSRSDKRGLGDTWTKVHAEYDIAYGIEHGYLSPVEGVRTSIAGLDLSTVRKSRGDFVDSALGDALAASHAAEQVAEAYLREAAGSDGLPRRGILFAPTVESAEEFARAFNAAGIVTEVVVGATAIADRRAAYARVESGETRVLASVMVLAVGFDLPCVEVAVMARPTKSNALYVQQAGRVMRRSPETGKAAALIMDVVGVSSLGLASFVDLGTTPPDVEVAPSPDEGDELDDEERGPRPPVEKTTIHGSIDLRPIDPLTGGPLGAMTKRAGYVSEWLTTAGGVPFLAPTRTFPGLLFATVGLDGARGWHARTGRGEASVVFTAPTLAAVKADLESMHPGEDQGWYRTTLAPSAGQIKLLREFGQATPPTMVQASREISRAKVGALLDPHFPVGTHRSEVPA